MSEVFISYRDNIRYPQDINPSVFYPEYPFSYINPQKNDVYDMIRECLMRVEYDKSHFGTKEWNPLGDIISPNMKVLIKPNLVMDRNENHSIDGDPLECLVTNVSCIRAICDYCQIALKGTGMIIIGDAPMQACNFDNLLEKTQLSSLPDFYSKNGYSNVVVKDLREYEVKTNRFGVLYARKYNDNNSVCVPLNEQSAHYNSKSNHQYQVSDYHRKETLKFHNDKVHIYEITKDVLDADVVINFCKPKTHRLAGLTGAMKNLVGITYNKACLPHRSAGSKDKGGDAYLYPNHFKKIADFCLTKKIEAENKGRFSLAAVLRLIYGWNLIIGKRIGKDPYFFGSWSGNETIAKTIIDLNYILLFADKNGRLCDQKQRKLLNFGDMIIAGEGNGPVKPSPKHLGMIMMSENSIDFDFTLCKIMGFDSNTIPLLRAIKSGETVFSYVAPYVNIMHNKINNIGDKLSCISFPKDWAFFPHEHWQNVIDNTIDRKENI